MKPKGPEDNFEQWVSNRFGKRLYNHFFKSYTEKVWGVPTTEIRAEWAAQRIKGLSFFSAAKAAFFGNKGNKIKSLIDAFQYPRYGPGQMWEQMTTRIEEMGGEVQLAHAGRADRARRAEGQGDPHAAARPSSRRPSYRRCRCATRSRSLRRRRPPRSATPARACATATS